jgi:hypothetical protein
LRFQADACAHLGSPLYADLLHNGTRELTEGEVLLSVLRGHEADPPQNMLALRLMGAVHRLVLAGAAPVLATQFPSAGGEPDEPWPAFIETVATHAGELRELIEHPVQTNETARCTALLGGFLEVARLTALPLRLLEVGASAGLNLRFDRYRYELGARTWGRAGAEPVLRAVLSGEPPLDAELAVASRAGCDARPVDPTTDEGLLTLSSYVWADQVARLDRLRAACRVAVETDAEVVAAGAESWTRERLADAAPGTATVVFHSIVMQYVEEQEREGFRAALREAGARATAEAPLAWLRMEPADLRMADLQLTVWPSGDERVLARVGYHGDPVEWVA